MKIKIFGSILLLFVVLSTAGLAIAAGESKQFKEYVIKAKGTGRISIEPDSFSLVFVVQSESISLRRAIKDNAKKISTITDEIKKLKIPNIEFSTSTFDYARGGGIISGKKNAIENKVTVKAEKLEYDKLSDYASSVVDASIENGANTVRGLSFYLENEKIGEDRALKAALDNAKSKASLIAEELGVKLKEPYNVLRYWFTRPTRRRELKYDRMVLKEEAAAAGGGAQVVSGKKIYSAEIELEYKFE